MTVQGLLDAGSMRSTMRIDTQMSFSVGLLSRLPFSAKVLPRLFRSCAIVGASSHLKGMMLGDEIDGHEMVMRFNQHRPSASAGGDLGVRTSIRFVTGGYGILDMADEWANDPDPITEPPELFGVTYLNDYSDVDWFVRAADTLSAAGLNLPMLVGPELVHMVQAHERALYTAAGFSYEEIAFARRFAAPVAGRVGLLLACQICEKVSAYGFGILIGEFNYIDPYGPLSKKRKQTTDFDMTSEDQNHNYEAEKAFLVFLRDNLHIEFK